MRVWTLLTGPKPQRVCVVGEAQKHSHTCMLSPFMDVPCALHLIVKDIYGACESVHMSHIKSDLSPEKSSKGE